MLVIILGAFLGASSITPDGPTAVFPEADRNSVGAAFAFLLAAVVSLQILTRLPAGQSTGSDEKHLDPSARSSSDRMEEETPTLDEALPMARRRVLAVIAALLIPASFVAGIYAAWPSVTRFPDHVDLIGLFVPLMTAILIAVFAADASLAADEEVDDDVLAEVSHQRTTARIQLEIDVLSEGVEIPPSGLSHGGLKVLAWCVRWISYVLPSLAFIVFVAIWNPVPTASAGVLGLAIVAIPLIAFFSVTMLGFVVRRDWISAFLTGIGGVLYALLLIVSMATTFLPEDPRDPTITVPQFFLALTLALLAFLLPAASALLSLGSFMEKHPGALRWRAIRSAERRLQRLNAGKAKGEILSPRVAWYAWGSLLFAVILPPLGALLATAILIDRRSTSESRLLAYGAITVSLLVVGTALIWLNMHFTDTTWSSPWPFV